MLELTTDQIIQARQAECRRILTEAKADLTQEWVARIAECWSPDMVKAHIQKNKEASCEKYHHDCLGCKDGHNSFWQTITESDEWNTPNPIKSFFVLHV